MSSIPNSAIPHAVDHQQVQLYEQKHRPSPLKRVLRVLVAPPLITLGLSAMALDTLRRRPAAATI